MMDTRQKITIGVFAVIALIIAWQVKGMFGGGAVEVAPPPQTAAAPTPAAPAPMSKPVAQAQSTPEQQQQPMSPREMELVRLQQETQARYVEAVRQLQMLKIARDIAEVNQAIAASRLATVTSEKSILTMLAPAEAPPTPVSSYTQNLENAAQPTTSPSQVPSITGRSADVTYTVISVSQLQYKWSAVIGAQGNLYSVTVGDVLSPDGSKVISISKTGIVLEKEGVRKKVSLMSAI